MKIDQLLVTTAIPCIICRKSLINLDQIGNQPSRATEMIGGSCYGSAITDTNDGWAFVVNICDICMEKAIAAGQVLKRCTNQIEPGIRFTYKNADWDIKNSPVAEASGHDTAKARSDTLDVGLEAPKGEP